MLPDNPTRDQIEAVFANDRFATQAAGCRVVEGERGRAVCEMELADIHKNAMGNVMGGAIFTLADFALAVSCNIGEEPTVSVDSNISFLRATQGTRLTATSVCDKPGRHLGFYTVTVKDDLGKDIARMTATCYRSRPGAVGRAGSATPGRDPGAGRGRCRRPATRRRTGRPRGR